MHLSPLFLYLIIFILSFCLSISVYYLWKFARLILALEDSLEISLDILDKRYKSMFEILQKPIFFDSMEVRQCINEIKKSREAILYVANVLTDPVREAKYAKDLNNKLEDKEITNGEKES
jgi:hypothetical protein